MLLFAYSGCIICIYFHYSDLYESEDMHDCRIFYFVVTVVLEYLDYLCKHKKDAVA